LFVTAEGAMTIVRELGGRGFAFQIGELMSQERAAEFLTALAAADPITHWTPR